MCGFFRMTTKTLKAIVSGVHKLIDSLQRRGALWVLMAAVSRLTCGWLDLRVERRINVFKWTLGKRLARSVNFTVKYGVFAGLKLSENAAWGSGDLATQCLGLYEQEIQNYLREAQARDRRSVMLDLGGADGFFAVGSLVSGLFDECYVFESNPRSREMLMCNAKRNEVSENMHIRNEATEDAILRLLDTLPKKIFVLCDIEGAEYSVFTEAVLEKLGESEIIIEIHEFCRDMELGAIALRDKAAKYFEICEIRSRGRDLSRIPETEFLSDVERALLASEGRSRLGKWWILTPRAQSLGIADGRVRQTGIADP